MTTTATKLWAWIATPGEGAEDYIIAMLAPGLDMALPLVSSSLSAMEAARGIADRHAEQAGCAVRLGMFVEVEIGPEGARRAAHG